LVKRVATMERSIVERAAKKEVRIELEREGWLVREGVMRDEGTRGQVQRGAG
jgi:hypothetical protein